MREALIDRILDAARCIKNSHEQLSREMSSIHARRNSALKQKGVPLKMCENIDPESRILSMYAYPYFRFVTGNGTTYQSILYIERIPNLTGEQSNGITVFRIPPMTSLMLHRCRTGAINLQSRHDSIDSSSSFVPYFRCNVTSLMPPDRKKAVRRIFEPKKCPLSIPVNEIETTFNNKFNNVNHHHLDNYPNHITEVDKDDINNKFLDTVSKEEILKAMQVLRKAKIEKEDVTILFLDVHKAYDTVGHRHLESVIHNSALPQKLQDLIINLQCGNETQIEVGIHKTKPIPFKQGVMQGAPLSPMLFNLSIDHIFDELSEPSVAEEFGYDLVSDLNNVVTLGFADDIALVAKSTIAASEIFTMTKQSLQQIGLSLNESKTQTIVIEKGKLSSTTLNLGGSIVNSIDGDERIKYLGINFSDEIKFDIAKVINNLNNKIQALTSTYLLKPEQKLNVLNMYIWPILVYPLQNAPLHQLSDRFLEDVDKLIKSSVKEILCLPGDTPDAMLYTERKYKGLSLFKAQWEAYLQHLNICNTLLRTSNPLVVSTRNIAAEKKVCSRKLKIPPEDLDISNINVHKLRQNLRKQEYCNETETLAHVLGSCQHGELLRNSRHHNIRKLIAQALRNKSLEVHEEVHCVASEGGGIRRADIVALDKTNSKGFILDPTVRFEMSQSQPSEVNKEKQQIYEPTIPYFREKYQMEGTWEVHGLMIGARGTIPRSTVNTIKTFGIHDIIPKIITSTIKGSVAILKNHLYGIS
ncbi:hypothetical protein ANN_17686 [Periplaneta americana]|uniref:Reverse transcriptase domain-containing protein n=1 Tax=Periplaneta americana TaxID=6978 RepID=A0ABQ8SUV3_PERAM|nr:hypothetical protein ANN_17686 [Periplaneta americana]